MEALIDNGKGTTSETPLSQSHFNAILVITKQKDYAMKMQQPSNIQEFALQIKKMAKALGIPEQELLQRMKQYKEQG
jgi:predicted PhzF superfamily epimerase YddE/YHI9